MLRQQLIVVACWLALGAVVVGKAGAQGEVHKLSGGFRFTEGPAADRQGNVYFSDIPNNRIHVWTLAGKLKTFREDSGGANGLFFDHDGNLIACEGGARRVTCITPGGAVTVLADRYQGKRFNSPNDCWVDPQGGIYFTDPRYGKMEGRELSGFWVFYITPDRKQVIKVIDDLVKPNGIIGTKDGKLLYVADPGANRIYAYDIVGQGRVANRRLFCEKGSDGMTLDERGNLYITQDQVYVFSPEGEQIRAIRTPERPANVCFGGADRKTLFITARTSLYAVKLDVKGQY